MTRILIIVLCFLFSSPVFAQERREDKGAYEIRLHLADQMLDLNPPRDQVRSAIDHYIEQSMAQAPSGQQEEFRSALLNVINYRALERLSRKAYAETFTKEELSAMVAYYSTPEARSAREKTKEFQGKIYPVITRMIDQALIRARTTQP